MKGDGLLVCAQSCMVRTPSKSQPTRLPISFVGGAREISSGRCRENFRAYDWPNSDDGQLPGVVSLGG